MPQQGGSYNNVYRGLYGGDKRGLYGSGGSGGRRNPMIYGKPPRRWPRVLLVVVLIAVVVLCVRQFACGGILPQAAQEQGSDEQQQEQEQEQTQAQEQQVSGREGVNGSYHEGLNGTVAISGIGDVALGADVNFDDNTNFNTVFNKVKTGDYFFKNVLRFLRDDQLTVCDFEGTLTDGGQREDKTIALKGPTKYANILKKGSVEAANLGNGHSSDYGSDSYQDTKKALESAKVTHFGFDATATVETKEGITIGLFGVDAADTSYEEATSMMKEDIEDLQDKDCSIIVGEFRWGEEGSHTTEKAQVTMAHAAVDAGCDLVLGGSPHVLQGVEYYNNRYICYSLGNFCYGGNDDPKDYDTMIFRQTFTVQDGQLVIDDSSRASAAIVPCSVSSSTKVNNYQPSPLASKKVAAMVKKLNGYSKKLSGDGVQFATKLDDDGYATVK